MEKSGFMSGLLRSSRLLWGLGIVLLLLLAILLAWISNGYSEVGGWISFLVIEIIAAALVLACWRVTSRVEKQPYPVKFAYLLFLAVIIRLAIGVLWFIMLPAHGHDSPPEQAGYVLADAYQRDQAAWDLAKSEDPLWSAFRSRRSIDQYGGMLFSSALVYRFLGGETHKPLMIVVLTAAVSSLAVLFTYGFARRTWSAKTAWIAAWMLTLFPDAVLNGSSQMREAATITLVMMAFYGLVIYDQERTRTGLIWMVAAILLFLPFSPPFAALLLTMLAAAAFFGFRIGRQRLSVRLRSSDQRSTWLVAALVGILVLVIVWWSLGQFTPDSITNPLERVNWWLQKSADLQSYLTERASGKIQAIFERTPEWAHTPLLLGYGVAQPLLPAALIDTSEAAIWQAIAIWRALGWTILLVLLIYATWQAWRNQASAVTRTINILVWSVYLVASFRGGGDQWDNPRYRVPFLGLMVSLAAWGWVRQRQSRDRVFRYVVISVLAIVVWLVPWYLYRKFSFPWPVEDLFISLGLAVLTSVLLILIDLFRNYRSRDRA